MRVLVLRFGSLGDVVLTLPALRRLKEARPDWKVSYVTRTPFAPLLAFAPDVDQVLALGEGESLSSLLSWVRPQQPELVLDLHGSLRSRALSLALGKPTHRSPGYRRERSRLVKPWRGALKPVPAVWKRHVETVERALEAFPAPTAVLDVCGVEHAESKKKTSVSPFWYTEAPLLLPRVLQHLADKKKTGPETTETDPETGDHAPDLHIARDGIALLPGARWAAKCWPVGHWQDLARRLVAQGHRLWILGSRDERSLLSEVAEAANADARGGERAWVVCDGWEAVLSALAIVTLAVGQDSGLTHLAEALGTPVLTLFGPTVPAFGFGPRLAASRVLERELSCRPCHLHGGKVCPKGHHACLRELRVETVEAAVLEQLNRAGTALDR